MVASNIDTWRNFKKYTKLECCPEGATLTTVQELLLLELRNKTFIVVC